MLSVSPKRNFKKNYTFCQFFEGIKITYIEQRSKLQRKTVKLIYDIFVGGSYTMLLNILM